MTDENYNFAQARTRLEEIVAQVRKKDVSLEKSLDLLEEGVRLANICTEQSDHTEWRSVIAAEADGSGDAEAGADVEAGSTEPDEESDGDPAADDSEDESVASVGSDETDGEDPAPEEA